MANHHASPAMMQMQQHQSQAPLPPPPLPPGVQPSHFAPSHQIAAMFEAVWLQIGRFSELLRVPDEAMHAYERALQANPNSTPAMNAIGMLLKGREAFDQALEFFRAIIQLDQHNGEAWRNLGHCYLMTENLQKAHDAYQQALVHLRDPKDPMLWYGIGILYDRYGSYDYAEEAFSQVIHIQPDFEKASEIYFRLGIIYKQQSKYSQSLDCFKYIVNSPPGPSTQEDIWFQIGHVHEQQKDFDSAKAAYQRVLDYSPNHAKVLQQLGWLHHQQSTAYESQDRAIQYLEKSVDADNQDSQSWYLLGRCYMSQQKYPKAYEAYQQAVYHDGKNPTFWCSIGVLFYQIKQYRDALDAYSRAIRLNPNISEVWYDLGTLYESCNNPITDALEAYQRAAELDPGNPHIRTRLQLLRSGGTSSCPPPAALQPADVHPQAYQAADPVGPQWGGSTQQPPASGPPRPPQGAGENWAGRPSNINPLPQLPNPYESRGEPFCGEPFCGGPAPPLPRQPSPRQDQQMHQPYNDPNRSGPCRRGQTPPPQGQQYSQPPHLPPPQSQAAAPASERRVANPNWGGVIPSASAPPSNINAPSGLNAMAPSRLTNSPRPDGRPVHDNRMSSPKSEYQQHPEMPAQASENGPPGPPGPPPLAAAEAAMQRIDDRPPSVGPTRMREREEESAAKKQANKENRIRHDDMRHRSPSTPPRDAYRCISSEARRVEDQRRADEQRRAEEPQRLEPPRHPTDNYHPSDAADYPPSHAPGPRHLPPMQQGPSPLSGVVHEKPQAGPLPKKERSPSLEHTPPTRAAFPASEPERAARKMEVDEDYDDSGEDEKKSGIVTSSGPGSATGDAKTTPANTSVNGVSGPAPTVE